MVSLLYPCICFDMAEGDGGGGSDTGGSDTGGGSGSGIGNGGTGEVPVNPPLIPVLPQKPTTSPVCPGCGCMDNGNMPNTYQNNLGFTGSIFPGTAAINYDPNATVDDGTCIYGELARICGCNDPSSLDFIGQDYQNGYGMPGIGGGGTYSPDWNLHPGLFTDCVGNIRNSVPYLAIGPYGDTSCCEQPDDRFYNYRDLFQGGGAGGPTNGIFRGVGVDGGCQSGGLTPYGHSDPRYDGHIGFNHFSIAPNLKDVHGNLFDLADFHTSDSGWTIQIYDKDKIYLGTWHYEECVSWKISPDPYQHYGSVLQAQGEGHYLEQVPPHLIPGAGQLGMPAWDYGLQDNIRLRLRGVTHIDGPYPIVNYGNGLWPFQPNYIGVMTEAQLHHGTNPHFAYKMPKYYDQNFWVLSASHAYMKITVDKNRSISHCNPNPNPSGAPTTSGTGGPVTNPQGKWFESIDTGPNTVIDKMNVMCLPCFKYKVSLNTGVSSTQWATGNIGTRCCVESSTIRGTVMAGISGPLTAGATAMPCGPWHDNPHYNFPLQSHWLHPWAASHQQMIVNANWYQDLATGYSQCRTGAPCNQ